MSNSALISYTNLSPNCTANRTWNGKKYSIEKITIHHMAGNLSIESCGNLFADPKRQASANYGIGTDGRIGLYVEEKDRAWTSGNRDNDLRAVTIEVANCKGAPNWEVSDKAYASIIELCVDICRRNGIQALNFTGNKNGNLTMHCYFQSTACPGPYLKGKFASIADEVNKRLSGTAPTQTQAGYTHTDFVKDVQKAIGAKVDGIAGPETLSKTVTVSRKKNNKHAVVKPIQKYLNSIGCDCGSADGVAGLKTEAGIRKFQISNGCIADGEVTAKQKTWQKLLMIK